MSYLSIFKVWARVVESEGSDWDVVWTFNIDSVTSFECRSSRILSVNIYAVITILCILKHATHSKHTTGLDFPDKPSFNSKLELFRQYKTIEVFSRSKTPLVLDNVNQFLYRCVHVCACFTTYKSQPGRKQDFFHYT